MTVSNDNGSMGVINVSDVGNLHVKTLGERIINVIAETCEDGNVTRAEITGTLEFVKLQILGVFDD